MNSIIYKNFSWNLFGSLIYALTQYLLIIVIGRFGDSELLGLYSLGLALTAPIMMFTNLKLRNVQSTGYNHDFNFNDFAFVRTFGNIIFFLVVVIVTILLDYSLEIFLVIILLSISKIVESFSDLFYGTLQFNERLDKVAKSYILRGVLSVALFSLTFLYTENIYLSITTIILSWTIILVFYDFKNTVPYMKIKRPIINKKSIIRIVWIALPLGLISLLASLNANIPRIIIENNLTLEELGYFTSVFYLTIILGKFVTSLGAAILPKLSRLYEKKEHYEHLKLTLKFSIFILILGLLFLIVSYFLGDQILNLIYGPEFNHLGSLLVLVMLYGLFNYLYYSIKISLESTKTFNPQLFVEIINISVTIILSIIFIPRFGIDGAIYSLLLSVILSIFLLTVIYIRIILYLKRGVNYK